MEALILSCGTGGGHNSAGKAILEELLRRGHKAVMINPYDLKSNKLSNKIDNTYIATARKIPKVFGSAYKLAEHYTRLPFRSPVYFVNKAMNCEMNDYLSQNHFDIVIMPHLFPAEILTNMKKHGMRVPKTVFVSTDYTCIPFTEETDCDAYIIPSDKLKDEYISRGIREDKIYSFGIPVSDVFKSCNSKSDAKRKLELSECKKYIFVAGGSMGGGKFEKSLDKIVGRFCGNNKVGVIAVCGNNKKLCKKLTERYKANRDVNVIGYTNAMAYYMRACDLFVTKPGGLSSTEAAVCGIPILHTAAIPGCETENAKFFSANGMSISGDITDEVLIKATELLENTKTADEMIQAQKICINADAVEDICDFAEKLTNFQQKVTLN